MGRVSERGVVKVYHVELMEDEGWYIGRVLERAGVTTQGRSLDELVYMLRDAIGLMWGERNVQLELIAPTEIRGRARTRRGSIRQTPTSAARTRSPSAKRVSTG